MPFQSYMIISERLEDVKMRGKATDYLVRWVGTCDELRPRVTIWNEHGTGAQVRAEFTELLADFVPADAIEILPA